METGMVKVLKVAAAHDVGKVVNPPLCRGQIEGGVLQGVGYAVREEMTYVEGKGFYNKGFHSYMLPTADDRPEIESILVENPDPSGVYGIIGIGECGVNPTLAAIGNAVADATGVRFHEFPLIRPGAGRPEGRRKGVRTELSVKRPAAGFRSGPFRCCCGDESGYCAISR